MAMPNLKPHYQGEPVAISMHPLTCECKWADDEHDDHWLTPCATNTTNKAPTSPNRHAATSKSPSTFTPTSDCHLDAAESNNTNDENGCIADKKSLFMFNNSVPSVECTEEDSQDSCLLERDEIKGTLVRAASSMDPTRFGQLLDNCPSLFKWSYFRTEMPSESELTKELSKLYRLL